jgi:hypothetical protein
MHQAKPKPQQRKQRNPTIITFSLCPHKIRFESVHKATPEETENLLDELCDLILQLIEINQIKTKAILYDD